MILNKVINPIQKLLNLPHVLITRRGNASIKSALSIVNDRILIPDEGGWLTYETEPAKHGLEFCRVKCIDAKIDLADLRNKLLNNKYGAFLYHQPGGYFAEQPIKEIHNICNEHDCLVIMDVSGSIGTELYDERFADIIVGSFGRWKLINAGKGGFIASNDELLFEKIKERCQHFNSLLEDEKILSLIYKKLEKLPARINFLLSRRNKIIDDLQEFDVVYPKDSGIVVIVKYNDENKKMRILEYCKNNSLEWTECPRYIRLNEKAISIEVKRL